MKKSPAYRHTLDTISTLEEAIAAWSSDSITLGAIAKRNELLEAAGLIAFTGAPHPAWQATDLGRSRGLDSAPRFI
jgi:hypothetical protein